MSAPGDSRFKTIGVYPIIGGRRYAVLGDNLIVLMTGLGEGLQLLC